MSHLFQAFHKRAKLLHLCLSCETPYVRNNSFHLLVVEVSSEVLGNNGVKWSPHLVRDSGVDHLQEFILSPGVLVHYIFGLVDHLYQAILLSHHFIFLAFDLDVRIRL